MSRQTRRDVTDLLARHGLSPRKRYGQNFLADANIVARIVRTARVGPTDRVVEVGAGTGALTVALADTGATVVAYELDRSLVPVLEEALAGYTVDLRMRDAADGLSSELAGSTWTMVANLPYNVGTGIVLDALRAGGPIDRFVVMVQREVADRLLAAPGTRAYGVPSVTLALHAKARLAFTVAPQVFVPPPQVDSAVLEIDRSPADPRAAEAIVIAAAAFGQRRKMLRRSLAGVFGDPLAALEAADLDPTARAESVAPEGWLGLVGSS